jgi:hypothetical protein
MLAPFADMLSFESLVENFRSERCPKNGQKQCVRNCIESLLCLVLERKITLTCSFFVRQDNDHTETVLIAIIDAPMHTAQYAVHLLLAEKPTSLARC